MFPYPCGQMSDSFANIGRICITQTCKFVVCCVVVVTESESAGQVSPGGSESEKLHG